MKSTAIAAVLASICALAWAEPATNGWVTVMFGGTGYLVRIPPEGETASILNGSVTVDHEGAVTYNVPDKPAQPRPEPVEVTFPDGKTLTIPRPPEGGFRSVHHSGRTYYVDDALNVLDKDAYAARMAAWEESHPEEAAERSARRAAAMSARAAAAAAAGKSPRSPMKREEVRDPGWAEPAADTPEKTAAINSILSSGRKAGRRKSLDPANSSRPGARIRRGAGD